MRASIPCASIPDHPAIAPDNRLCVGRFNAGQILAIEPGPCSCDPAEPADLACLDTVDDADLGLTLASQGRRVPSEPGASRR
ncbi:MAG TPA: hypothetical protein PKC43_05685 [Phycisphaerales bacterium]|nr:hypothetical protein [Phycisphaerales bacterium]HMP36923.1 hypothetical protein [Phycisphaerales bacterium]